MFPNQLLRVSHDPKCVVVDGGERHTAGVGAVRASGEPRTTEVATEYASAHASEVRPRQ